MHTSDNDCRAGREGYYNMLFSKGQNLHNFDIALYDLRLGEMPPKYD